MQLEKEKILEVSNQDLWEGLPEQIQGLAKGYRSFNGEEIYSTKAEAEKNLDKEKDFEVVMKSVIITFEDEKKLILDLGVGDNLEDKEIRSIIEKEENIVDAEVGWTIISDEFRGIT
ncbi:hypothetical protein KKF32_01425 [Patescibacteria group bacterium]|nr:hypothetical protein [Patescibacteria group bacterium]